MYTVTPKLRELPLNRELCRDCIAYVSKSERHPPSFRDVFQMFCGMTYGTTIRDLCLRLNPHALRIDEQRLVRFGVLKGIIRRIQKVLKKKRKEKKRRGKKGKKKERKDEESSAIVLNVLSFD